MPKRSDGGVKGVEAQFRKLRGYVVSLGPLPGASLFSPVPLVGSNRKA